MASIGLNNPIGGPAINAIGRYQNQLQTGFAQASSGKRLVSGAIDPSGLAIYNALEAQSNGFDQATYNVQDASNAINVAQGALSNSTDALQQLRSLAITASNDFLSPNDRAALQAHADQLVQQINTNATQVNFNGQPLLNGQFSGTTPAQPASATVTSNAILGAGGSVVTSATASGAAVSGTIGISVVNTGASGIQAQVTFTDTATQTVTAVGTFAAGSTFNVNGTSVTVGNFGPGDASATATIEAQAATAGSNGSTLNVQSGANQGASTQVTLANGTSTGLGIANIDFSTSANATNAIGQIDRALQTASQASAQLGAQTVSLQTAGSANQTASLNLTSSAAAIGDTDYATLSSELNSIQLRNTLSIETLQQANTLFGYLNRFLNSTA